MRKQSATYQQLQAALQSPGCPVCRLGQEAGRAYLDSLLWESVNDPRIQRSIAGGGGFCGRHSRELLTFPGARLGAAILERAVLRQALQTLDAPAPGKPQAAGLRERFIGSLGGRQNPATGQPEPLAVPCPACAQQDEAERRALDVLLHHLAGELDQALVQAGGLCIPHLQQAMQMTNSQSTINALREVQRQAWAGLVADLDEFIRKNDHRFRKEPMSEEQRMAVERAVAVTTGEYPKR